VTLWQSGDKAYKVMVYGGDDMDPSREIEPGDEHRTKAAAVAEARTALAAKVGHEDGLWWSADVDRGVWIETSYGTLDWEPDQDRASVVFVLVEGRVVAQ
jgi:hypothetical protein